MDGSSYGRYDTATAFRGGRKANILCVFMERCLSPFLLNVEQNVDILTEYNRTTQDHITENAMLAGQSGS